MLCVVYCLHMVFSLSEIYFIYKSRGLQNSVSPFFGQNPGSKIQVDHRKNFSVSLTQL